MVFLTLRGPYITVEVGDGDGVSRPPTRAFDGDFENKPHALRTCSISASCAINARKRTTARYSVSRRLT
jgi:hypothetical protein